MITRFSLKKSFFYLTGLVVACFFHFSCQFLPEDKLNVGNETTNSSKSDDSTSSITAGIKNNIDVGFAGYSKEIRKELCHRPYKYDIIKEHEKPKIVPSEGNNKMYKIGGDTLIIKDLNNGTLLIGVADNAYEDSLEPETMSKALMENIVSPSSPFLGDKESPKEWIQHSHEIICNTSEESSDFPPYGLTTACVAIIGPKRVDCANLGDSSIMIINPAGDIVYKSNPEKENQQYEFNVPFLLYKNKSLGKTADDCFTKGWDLQKGWRVLIGTDGVFDNLCIKDIIEEVKQNHSAQETADNIVEKAYTVSQNPEAKTPFGEKARDNDKNYKTENKRDDMTLIVAIIK